MMEDDHTQMMMKGNQEMMGMMMPDNDQMMAMMKDKPNMMGQEGMMDKEKMRKENHSGHH